MAQNVLLKKCLDNILLGRLLMSQNVWVKKCFVMGKH